MALISKLIPVHAVANNAPLIISVLASSAVPAARYFFGTGAPATATLAAGNSKYNATSSGFVISAAQAAAGSGYTPGNILTCSGGTGTTAQITVDAVTAAGAILNWHVSRVGAYSAYPANPVAVTGGAGSGAQFNLDFPAADFYFDVTAPASPVLYVCTSSGSNAVGSTGGSAWSLISGGINWQTPYKELDPTVAVAQGTWIYLSPGNALVTTGMIDLVAGTVAQSPAGIWQAAQNVPAQVTISGVTKYNVPQIPYPGASGTPSGSPLKGDLDGASVFWVFIQEKAFCLT